MIVEHWRHDLRLAWRSLLRARAFTGAAVLTMALGIGGTTVMFALIEGVLLRPLPVREQDRLIVAWKEFPSGGFAHWPFQVAEIEVIGRESRLLERVGGVSYGGASPGIAVENGAASYISNASVTGTFFAALGVGPILGRALEPADDVPGAEKVLVITHGLWQRRYGGSRDVVGRRLILSDQPFTIVGVMPPDFAYPRGVEGWMTVEVLASLLPNPTFREAVRRENDLIARLRPGVTREQALRELQGLVARLEADARLDIPRGLGPVVRSYEDVVVGDVRPAMVVLFAAVALVLLPQAKHGERARPHLQFLDDVVAQLEGAPGIERATPVTTPPFAGTGGWDAAEFTAEGQSPEQARTNPSLNFEAVYPNHFVTLGVPVVRGRAFTEADRPGAPEVAIVSEDVAARVWPGEDPIGKRLKLGGADFQDPWRMVVGVVKPTRYRELAVARATLYLPAPQFIVSAQTLVVRTALPLAALADLARERVHAVDPDARVMSVVPFGELLKAPLARPRFNAFLIGIFGVASLLLAAIGLYAVMAAYVRQRHAEIGIRLTLGATASDVRRLVLGEGLRLAGVGAAIGLAIAVAATRVVRGLLFAVDPLDPPSLLGAAVLLVGASVLACYLPARHATRVDPLAVLRTS